MFRPSFDHPFPRAIEDYGQITANKCLRIHVFKNDASPSQMQQCVQFWLGPYSKTFPNINAPTSDVFEVFRVFSVTDDQ